MLPDGSHDQALQYTQRSFLRAIRNTGFDLERELSPTARLSPHQQLQIYRNSHLGTLQNTLAAHYPVTRKLLGDSCFFQLTRRYVHSRHCSDSDLNHYGESLGKLIATLPELAALPYLQDIIELEWAWQRSQTAHASGTAVVLSPDLSHDTLLRVKVSLPESATLLVSQYPVERIWHFHRIDRIEEISLEQGSYAYVIYRTGQESRITALEQSQLTFLKLCQLGMSLGHLAGLWLNRLHRLDFSPHLAAALSNQWLNIEVHRPDIVRTDRCTIILAGVHLSSR